MTARPRIVWIDAARGLCVLAVVIMHATLSLYLDHVEPGPAAAFWGWAADAMTPFRMPGLAMLSGILLARRIRSGWAHPGVRISVMNSAWLYLIWLVLFALFAWGAGGSVWTSQVAGDGFAWDRVLLQLALPRTVLWYVFALGIWTVLLTCLRRVHPAIVLGALVAVSIASRYLAIDDGDAQIRNVLRYAVFFAIGALGATRLRNALARGDRTLLLGALSVFAATMTATILSGSDDLEHVLSVPRDAAAAVLLLGLVARVCRTGRIGAALAWIGRRTLPVYVMHVLLLDAVLRFVPGWDRIVDEPGIRAVAPLLIAIVASAICIGVFELIDRTAGRVLFGLPAPVRRRLGRRPARAGAAERSPARS